MSLKGNLASVNLTEIFQMLSLSGREGTLFIYEGARKRAICFTKEGVSIRSRERNESNLLGKILVRLGKVEEDVLAQAVEKKRSTNRLLGDVLVDNGACTSEDAPRGLFAHYPKRRVIGGARFIVKFTKILRSSQTIENSVRFFPQQP